MVWDVAGAEWMRALTDDRLAEALDEGTLARGEGYARGGNVAQVATLNRGRVVVAKVEGSRSSTYQTIVSQHGDVRSDVLEWSARCSCPVGHDCKHAVAVILTVRDALGGTEEPAASWEVALSGLTRERDPEPLDRGVAMALIVERTTAPLTPRDRYGVPRLKLRPTRRTKSGRWSKKFAWTEVRDTWGRAGLDERHRRALEGLLTMRSQQADGYAYTYGGPSSIFIDELGPDVWSALRRVRDAGVTLMADEEGSPVVLDDTPTEVAVDIARTDAGLLLRSVVGARGGDPEDAPEIIVVGDPGHGVAVTHDGTTTLAPFADPLTAVAGQLVAQPQGLTIPEPDVERFLTMYLPRLREELTVTSVDGSVDLPEVEPPRLHLHVVAAGSGIRVDFGFVYRSGESTHVVGVDAAATVPRNVRGEQALIMGIEALDAIPGAISRARTSTRWVLQRSASLRGRMAIEVMTTVLPVLERDERVVVVVDEDVPAFEELAEEPQIAIHAADEGAESSDWLDLHVAVTVGEVEVPFEPLFAALVRGDEIMQLESGEWFRLDHPVLDNLRALIEEARALADHESGELRVSRYQVGLWDDLSDLAEVQIAREHAWRGSVETLRELETQPAPPVPGSLQATLRPYQVDGYHWLSTLWDADLGGVLADDMGLGKTVQTLALLARAHEAGQLDRPVLVVAPTSVVGTWASEAAKFVPDLEVRALPQTHKRRKSPVDEAVAGAQLVVTSYAVLRIDADQFAEVDWRGVILDEAQFVKNDRSKTHQALRRLSAPFVLAVTGTPLENSLMDLWSLLALAAPGLYPRRDTFTEVYRKPIESGAQPQLLDRLRRRIRPLMLRRTKEQVALDLPPKQVQVLQVDLSAGHRRIYDRHLQQERKRVLGLLEDPDANRVAILASLTRLRQLSLDPGLVDEQHLGHGASAKIDLLVDHLRELAGEGHRALVFSQFTGFLGLVRERLETEGISTCYLDGSTTRRAEVIDEFKTGDATAFLISLKAGGVGLTLTEADYVFVLDPWWNPAAEAQAIDRAHRIGQDKPVMVYRLVSTGTIEEKVLALQERKRDLFERVVDDGGSLSGAITASDIRALLDPE